MGPPLRRVNRFMCIINVVRLCGWIRVSPGGGMLRFAFVSGEFATSPCGEYVPTVVGIDK